MACIPHTMQMVKSQKKRYSQSSDSKASKSKYLNFLEIVLPNRYSIKEMNAIWGSYNKDSVHNFKSMACDGVTAAEIQALVQGPDMVQGNQDMAQQHQIQHQLLRQHFKQHAHEYLNQRSNMVFKFLTSNT